MLSGIAKTEPGGKSNVERYRQTELEQRERRSKQGVGAPEVIQLLMFPSVDIFKPPKKFPGRPYRAGRAEPRLLGKAPRA